MKPNLSEKRLGSDNISKGSLKYKSLLALFFW